MRTFECYPHKICVEPLKEKSFFESEGGLQEMGKVVSVGKGVTFVKKGDTLFFSSWGCDKTPEVDGKVYYIVSDTAEFILGKINAKK